MDNNKRVPVLVHVISSLKIGGAERLLVDLVDLLHPYFKQHVIFFHDGPMRTVLEEKNIPVHAVQGAVCLYDPFFFTRLYRLLNKVQPDLVHSVLWSANWSVAIVRRLLSFKQVSALHNNYEQNGVVRYALDRLVSSGPYIAVSEQVKTGFKRHFPAVHDNDIRVIQNGVNVCELRALSGKKGISRQALGLMATDIVFGSVGRFEAVKNYVLMITAFALVRVRYDNARLVLVGIGSQEQLLRDLVRDLDVSESVHFIIGHPSYRYYSLFDYFVMSSPKEGVSIALLEALALGVPCVVTSESGGHTVITHEKTGTVVSSQSADDLARALIAIHEDPKRAQTCAQQGVAMVEQQYSLAAMGEEYIDFYMKIIKR